MCWQVHAASPTGCRDAVLVQLACVLNPALQRLCTMTEIVHLSVQS